MLLFLYIASEVFKFFVSKREWDLEWEFFCRKMEVVLIIF